MSVHPLEVPYLLHCSLEKTICLISNTVGEVEASYLGAKPVFDDVEGRGRARASLNLRLSGRHSHERSGTGKQAKSYGELEVIVLVRTTSNMGQFLARNGRPFVPMPGDCHQPRPYS
jgi:hypothetical protein